MNFDDLVKAIRDADFALVTRATKAVNVSLTMRNWLIGHYVSEYELHGADRAEYGKRILAELADHLEGVSNCSKRQLSKYVRFYRVYPQIGVVQIAIIFDIICSELRIDRIAISA
ncbi:hypothetical protein AGMMS49983_04470 [Clostridia bacterium]|nr:hypothetical protein AGMMS49983_04470 [Clostridia bacterium]